MHSFLARVYAAALAVALGFSNFAAADVVRYRFVGEVTESSIASGSLAGVQVGDRVTYRFGVDGDRPLYYIPNYTLTYLIARPILSFETSSGTIVVRGPFEVPGGAGVHNNANQIVLDPRLGLGWDGLSALVWFADGADALRSYAGVFDTSGSAFQGLPPPTSLELSSFDVLRWDIEDDNATKVMVIGFRSLAVVPEPTAIGLLSLVSIRAVRRRRGTEPDDHSLGT